MIEGLSLIALFFIAMPAKYGFDYDLVKYVGPIHGVLWLAYLPLLEMASRKYGWSKPMWNFGFLTSVIPFGCFALEKRYRKNYFASDCSS